MYLEYFFYTFVFVYMSQEFVNLPNIEIEIELTQIKKFNIIILIS